MFSSQSMRVMYLLLILTIMLACQGDNLPLANDFGTKVSETEIERWNIDIHLDGEGLPDGQGHSKAGEVLFIKDCAMCHGLKLDGVRAMGAGSMLTGMRAINKLPNATSLFDYIRRAMPLTDPGTLTDEETYALVAYLLIETDVITQDELVLDRESLLKIEMPNKKNYIIDTSARFMLSEKYKLLFVNINK